jgi:hypothetical protein
MGGHNMSSFKPPCYCERNKLYGEKEWHKWRGQYTAVSLNHVVSGMINSVYISRRWSKCSICRYVARRHMAVLAIFLAKLKVISNKTSIPDTNTL